MGTKTIRFYDYIEEIVHNSDSSQFRTTYPHKDHPASQALDAAFRCPLESYPDFIDYQFETFDVWTTYKGPSPGPYILYCCYHEFLPDSYGGGPNIVTVRPGRVKARWLTPTEVIVDEYGSKDLDEYPVYSESLPLEVIKAYLKDRFRC